MEISSHNRSQIILLSLLKKRMTRSVAYDMIVNSFYLLAHPEPSVSAKLIHHPNVIRRMVKGRNNFNLSNGGMKVSSFLKKKIIVHDPV